jgi:hypothetical protein
MSSAQNHNDTREKILVVLSFEILQLRFFLDKTVFVKFAAHESGKLIALRALHNINQ